MIENIKYTHGVEYYNPNTDDELISYFDYEKARVYGTTARYRKAVAVIGSSHSHIVKSGLLMHDHVVSNINLHHEINMKQKSNFLRSFNEIIEEGKNIPIRNYGRNWNQDLINPKLESSAGYQKPKSDSNVKPKKKKRKKKARNGR